MAQKVQIQLVDDLDGTEATETVAFGLDGATYEIDLNDKNASKLRKALVQYVDGGRRLTGPRPKRTRRSPSTSTTSPKNGQAKEIREWAAGQGMKVSQRGTIPKEVRDAYAAR